MLDFITHIFLITVIAWGLTQLWDMPREIREIWKECKDETNFIQYRNGTSNTRR